MLHAKCKANDDKIKHSFSYLSLYSKRSGGGVCEIPQVEEIKHSWCLR